MAESSVAIVSLAIALTAGIFAGRLAENLNFPKTIPLILTGILLAIISNLGIASVIIDIHAIREMAILTAEIALITVLFKEGMHLNLNSFRKQLFIIVLLAFFGTILTTVIVGIAVNLALSLNIAVALLVGAIFTPSDPAATFSALRSGKDSKIDEKFETILGGESALNDVIAIILVVVILIPAALSSNSNNIQLNSDILRIHYGHFLEVYF